MNIVFDVLEYDPNLNAHRCRVVSSDDYLRPGRTEWVDFETGGCFEGQPSGDVSAAELDGWRTSLVGKRIEATSISSYLSFAYNGQIIGEAEND